uniref:Kinesin motor domain-containing protein n=1 Tax=Ananas comosus var. bracteatus TaxID=296719 RepID=A0A6V7QXD4_ANACO
MSSCLKIPNNGHLNPETEERVDYQQKQLEKLKLSFYEMKLQIESSRKKWEEDLRSLDHQVQALKDNSSSYYKLLEENRLLYNQVQDLKGNIRVYSREGRKKIFSFNKIFGVSATQSEVFVDTQPLIRSVMDGYNVCIFAYGQTGSGKTYTMSGPDLTAEDTWGVNYRALDDLFRISKSRADIITYDVSVQMIEIYNEQVRDLLVADGTNRRYPFYCTCHFFNPWKELVSGSTIRGCLHLVDLAGSERVDKSEATGERLKEAQHINRSLSALGDVISALAQKSPHIPYRNSKLTQVLQDALGGQAKTLMFVHINPEVDAFGETISTLKFAERVSSIELGAAHVNKESGQVKELKEEVFRLKSALESKESEVAQLKDFNRRSASEVRHSRARSPAAVVMTSKPEDNSYFGGDIRKIEVLSSSSGKQRTQFSSPLLVKENDKSPIIFGERGMNPRKVRPPSPHVRISLSADRASIVKSKPKFESISDKLVRSYNLQRKRRPTLQTRHFHQFYRIRV